MGNANFDWLTIHKEHNSINPSMMQTLIAMVQSKDIAALVRVSKNEEVVMLPVLNQRLCVA
jgi:2-dehydro-3-deoxyglucarate aldolase